MPNGECPTGAANRQRIVALERDAQRHDERISMLEGAVAEMRVLDAVTDLRVKLLLVALPGVGSIIGGIITALVMRAMGG